MKIKRDEKVITEFLKWYGVNFHRYVTRNEKERERKKRKRNEKGEKLRDREESES